MQLSKKKPHGLDLAHEGAFALLGGVRHCDDSALSLAWGWGVLTVPLGLEGECHQSPLPVHTTRLSRLNFLESSSQRVTRGGLAG